MTTKETQTGEIIQTGELIQYDPQAHYLSVVERLASNPNVDVDKLQRIMDMQEHALDRESEKAFNADMVLAQAHIRTAVKNKRNLQTNSSYADLEAVITSAKPIYTDAGFALSFYEGVTEKKDHIRIMCDIMHREGHTKTRYYDVALDTMGIAGKVNKTLIHGGGSAVSYGRRYLTCMIFNIPTGDDNDGNRMDVITLDQAQQIDKLITESGADAARFLEWAGVQSINNIAANKFGAAMSLLKAKKAKPGWDK